MYNKDFSITRLIFVLIILIYGIRAIPFYWRPLSLDSDPFYLMNAVNLPFHEFGHFFFMFFGFGNQELVVWGGTIFQFLIPVIIFLYFLIKKQFYNCSIVLFWIAECLFYTANYIRDSRSQILPLLIPGGIHDWWFILSKNHLLNYDQMIARIVLCIGIILFVISTVTGIFFSRKVFK